MSDCDEADGGLGREDQFIEYAQQIALAGDRCGQVIVRYTPALCELDELQAVQRARSKFSAGSPMQQTGIGIPVQSCLGFVGRSCQPIGTPRTRDCRRGWTAQARFMMLIVG